MRNNNGSNFQAWMRKGDEDLAFAQESIHETEFYDHICFLAEQAVEKYLKAFIIKSKGRLDKKDKTHNLIYLASVCKKYGLNLEHFEEDLRWLSAIYIPARYPVHLEEKFRKVDALKGIKVAEKIMEFITKKIYAK